MRSATHFFVTKEDHLYKKGVDGAHKLVVDRSQRMYLMKASHDSLGHRVLFYQEFSCRAFLMACDIC